MENRWGFLKLVFKAKLMMRQARYKMRNDNKTPSSITEKKGGRELISVCRARASDTISIHFSQPALIILSLFLWNNILLFMRQRVSGMLSNLPYLWPCHCFIHFRAPVFGLFCSLKNEKKIKNFALRWCMARFSTKAWLLWHDILCILLQLLVFRSPC